MFPPRLGTPTGVLKKLSSVGGQKVPRPPLMEWVPLSGYNPPGYPPSPLKPAGASRVTPDLPWSAGLKPRYLRHQATHHQADTTTVLDSPTATEWCVYCVHYSKDAAETKKSDS